MILFDYGQGTLEGSVRGIGYQEFGGIVYLIAFWVIMLPLSYTFAFIFELRLTGIWLAIPIGSIIVFIVLTWVLMRADWQELAKNAIERVEYNKAQLESKHGMDKILVAI